MHILAYIMGALPMDYYRLPNETRLPNYLKISNLYHSGSNDEIINHAMDELEFTEEDISTAVAMPELTCISSRRYFSLIDRLDVPENEEHARFQTHIFHLFQQHRHDLVDPLLTSLSELPPSKDHWKRAAIREVFTQAASSYKEIWVKSFANDPAIGPEEYGLALFFAGLNNVNRPIFQWLLKAASHGDLLAVAAHPQYNLQAMLLLRFAVQQALLEDDSRKERGLFAGPKAQMVIQIFKDDEDMFLIPEATATLIADYVTEDVVEHRRGEEAEDSSTQASNTSSSGIVHSNAQRQI